MTSATIKLSTLRELVDAKTITRVVAIGVPGGFTLSVNCASATRVLSGSNGAPRCFTNLNTLSGFLSRCGVSEFEVDARSYQRVRVRKPRPDRAAALKKTRNQSILELV